MTCVPSQTIFVIAKLSFCPLLCPSMIFSNCFPPLLCQSCCCDSRQRCIARWLFFGWRQHHLPSASRIWVHHQSTGWKVQNMRARTHTHTNMFPFPPLILFFNSLFRYRSYDLVTLGAMSVTLMFQRPPFLSQTRTVWTPNNNFLVLDQVIMSREEVQPQKCDIRTVLSPYPLVLPYPLPRYTGTCAKKGPAVPELQVGLPNNIWFVTCALNAAIM